MVEVHDEGAFDFSLEVCSGGGGGGGLGANQLYIKLLLAKINYK